MGNNNRSQANAQAGAAAKADKAVVKPYIVLSGLDHDGEHFEAGDSVELKATEAAPLIKCGVVEDADATAAAQAAAQAAAEEAAALEAERLADEAQKAKDAADLAAANAANGLAVSA